MGLRKAPKPAPRGAKPPPPPPPPPRTGTGPLRPIPEPRPRISEAMYADPQVVVDFLNDAILADADAVSALVAYRVPCNEWMAEHPSIQVGEDRTVGLMGLLNGLCGTDGQGRGFVAVIVDQESGKVHGAMIADRRSDKEAP